MENDTSWKRTCVALIFLSDYRLLRSDFLFGRVSSKCSSCAFVRNCYSVIYNQATDRKAVCIVKYLILKARDTFEEHYLFFMKLAHGTTQNFREKIYLYTSYDLRGWF